MSIQVPDVDLEVLQGHPPAAADEILHSVDARFQTRFTWDYGSQAESSVRRLYGLAKEAQWNADTDLDWSSEVDQEREAAARVSQARAAGSRLFAAPLLRNWGEREWQALARESQCWLLSQTLHGEQGALLCSARLIEAVPSMGAKHHASTQAMDEARHVEVFARYLDEKIGDRYTANGHLRALLDDILTDSRWDMTFLGMQVMIEGIALASLGKMRASATDPLVLRLLRYVMGDEARHVAFGVLALQEHYAELTEAELLERQQFAFEAAVLMRDRFFQVEVWERLGVSAADAVGQLDIPAAAKNTDAFSQNLFSKIVPNCKKLGLLDANDGWLRKRFDLLGVTRFEDHDDPDELTGP